MVVNATLASMAKHGRGGAAAAAAAAEGMHVYHVASSTVNPLAFGDLSRFLFQHFTGSPYSDAAGRPIHVPPMRLFDTMEQFASYVETDALLRAAASPRRRRRRRRRREGVAAAARALRQVRRADHLPRQHLPALHLLRRQVCFLDR